MPNPGTGEIDADPRFVEAGGVHFSLGDDSPCIDAGDPAILDPDGTRSDMGAIYHDQSPTLFSAR